MTFSLDVVVIGYEPLAGEPDPKICFSEKQIQFVVPNDSGTDPLKMAEVVSALFKEKDVYVAVPGTQFDLYGTRHGRGGGWYDRFLAAVPGYWVRVGICFEDSFSNIQLERKKWDEPVDWVCVKTKSGIDFYENRSNTHKTV